MHEYMLPRPKPGLISESCTGAEVQSLQSYSAEALLKKLGFPMVTRQRRLQLKPLKALLQALAFAVACAA